MFRSTILLVSFLLLSPLLLTAESGDDAMQYWPQWRGPLSTGAAPDGNPPVEWNEEKNIHWKVRLPGTGYSTPAIWGNNIFISAAIGPENYTPPGRGASPTQSIKYIVMAVNRSDGQVLWERLAQEEVPHAGQHETSTWATPVVWENKLRPEIVTPGKRKIRSYDLSGKLLWEMDGRMSNLVIPSPFTSFGMVYITSGYVGDRHRPVYAIRPGASGDITPKEEQISEFIQWYLPTAGPYNPSPIVYGDYYYTLLDRGSLTCHDARTGEEVYGRNRFTPRASFTASPWAYNGKLFFLSEDGVTYVVEAGPEFKQLHTNSLDELCLSSPAACQGKLLIRTASRLYCFSNSIPGMDKEGR